MKQQQLDKKVLERIKERVRDLRSKGMTQGEIARRARIPPGHFSAKLAGEGRYFSQTELRRLAHALKTSLAYLWGEINNPDLDIANIELLKKDGHSYVALIPEQTWKPSKKEEIKEALGLPWLTDPVFHSNLDPS